MSDDASCLGDRLSAYLDEELRADEKALVVAHLDGCAECASELEELAASRRMLRRLPPIDPPEFMASLFSCPPLARRERVAAGLTVAATLLVWMWLTTTLPVEGAVVTDTTSAGASAQLAELRPVSFAPAPGSMPPRTASTIAGLDGHGGHVERTPELCAHLLETLSPFGDG